MGAEAQTNDPVTFFKTHFMHQYKLSDQSNAAKSLLTISEEEAKRTTDVNNLDSDEEIKEEFIDDDDKVAKTDPAFKTW